MKNFIRYTLTKKFIFTTAIAKVLAALATWACLHYGLTPVALIIFCAYIIFLMACVAGSYVSYIKYRSIHRDKEIKL